MIKSMTSTKFENSSTENAGNFVMPDPFMTIGNKIVYKSISGKKGRGVYALVDFKEGEVIEISPVTVVPKAEMDVLEAAMDGREIVIDSYLFVWQKDVEGQEYCLGHGYMMLYNHNGAPNGYLIYDFENKTIGIAAKRAISAGEEITFDYECPLWFDAE